MQGLKASCSARSSGSGSAQTRFASSASREPDGSAPSAPIPPQTVERIRATLIADDRHRDATLLSVLAYAGLRLQEALALEWPDNARGGGSRRPLWSCVSFVRD